MAPVTLDKITKVYPNGFQAVTDLSLELEDGEFMVLVGPSGCGKSTALRMIAGLEDITDGSLVIDGKTVNEVEPKDRDIAMVFQNYALYPQMSVRENIAFPLKLRKVEKGALHRQVQEAAEILELTEQLDKKPGQLSGGQRQRVAMGRAIVRRPKLFLMDEPLSNLDAKLRVQMRADIAGIQRELGVTTFYVTHDQIEAMTMGDRVAVIKDGHLQQVDAPENLYAKPDNVFVAAFIGSPRVLSAGTVRRAHTTCNSVRSRSLCPPKRSRFALRSPAISINRLWSASGPRILMMRQSSQTIPLTSAFAPPLMCERHWARRRLSTLVSMRRMSTQAILTHSTNSATSPALGAPGDSRR